MPVDVRGCLFREAAGVVGDPQRLPHRYFTAEQTGPDARQAVGALDDLPDVAAPRVERPPEERGELGDREVADQRGAGAGDGEPGVQSAFGDRRGCGLVIDHVEQRPRGDLLRHRDLALGDGVAVLADRDQQLVTR